MTVQKIAANGIQHSVAQAGDGPPMILLHGWPQTKHAWRKIIPALSEHYKVFAPDLRGLGDTEKPDGPYDLLTAARDLKALIEELELEKPYIVGHDWGGLIARRFALEWPGLADRVAILDVAPHEGALVNLNVTSALGLWHFFFLQQADLAAELIVGREKSFLTEFFRGKCHDPETFIPECVDDYARAYAAPGALRPSLKYYQALFAENRALEQRNPGRKITAPMLVLWGTSGGVGAVIDMMAVWGADAEHLAGKGFDNCGHYMAEEIPDEITRELLAFGGAAG